MCRDAGRPEIWLVARGHGFYKPATLRNQHIAFWAITVVLLVLIAFPWYAPLFLA